MKKIDSAFLLFLSATLFMLPFQSIMAQETINQSLIISNRQTTISLGDTLKELGLRLNYKPTAQSSLFNSQLMAEYPVLVAKAGLSIPFAPTAGVYFQPFINRSATGASNSLTLKINHNSYWNKNKTVTLKDNNILTDGGRKAYARDWNTGGNIVYDRDWKRGALTLEGFWRNVNNSYYGLTESAPKEWFTNSFIKNNNNHTFNQGGVNFAIHTIVNDTVQTRFKYAAKVNYMFTSDRAKMASYTEYGGYDNKEKLRENYLKINIEGGPTFGKYAMATLGITSETAFYSACQDYRHSLLDIYLQYRYDKGNWHFNFGGTLSFALCNKGDDYIPQAPKGIKGKHTYITPRVSATYSLVPNKVQAYAVAGGGNVLNNYSALIAKAPWISPWIDMRTTAIPLSVRVGLKGVITPKATFDVYAGYIKRKGMPEFYSLIPLKANGSYLDVEYTKKRIELTVGGKFDFQTDRLKIGGDLHYSSYNKQRALGNLVRDRQHPLGYAPFEGYFYGEYNYRNRIYLGTKVLVHSKTPQLYGEEYVKAPAYANVILYGQYVLNYRFSIYAEASNLCNATIINQGLYVEKGVGIGGGVLVKF